VVSFVEKMEAEDIITPPESDKLDFKDELIFKISEKVDNEHFGEYPFNPAVHIMTAEPTSEQRQKVAELRGMLQDFPPYYNHFSWADETQLLRFLIARNFKMKDSLELIVSALKWRDLRKPADIELGPNWPGNMSRESETGKIYSPGHDKWGRPVLILNNTVENTKRVDDQMTFLAWNLEYAIKRMPPHVDKYLVFMHLTNFSFFNTPPLSATKETIHMVCSCFPERLGHCIVYQPPTVFSIFFNTVKGFLDTKTVSKMIFLSGEMSDGSANDIRMRELIGDNWKVLTGAEQPVLAKNISPGYDHEQHWLTVMENLADLKAKQHAREEDVAAAVTPIEGSKTTPMTPMTEGNN
jgi:hypothetical protein